MGGGGELGTKGRFDFKLRDLNSTLAGGAHGDHCFPVSTAGRLPSLSGGLV